MKKSITIKCSPNYNKNSENCKPNESPCIICGKGISGPAPYVHAHNGTLSFIVTEEEAERLNAAGKSGADMGCWPIGPDCLKKNPQLKPFLQGNK